MPPSSMPLAADGASSTHSAPPGEACTLLSSRPEGLTREEAADRLRRSGPNVLRKPRGRAHVRRDGGEAQIPAEELVPGDILILSEGDHVSADARVIAETELRIDQSTLTGESHPVRKTREAVSGSGLSRCEFPNLVFAGTTVAAGNGVADLLCHSHLDTVISLGSGEVDIVETEIPPLLVGRTVPELRVPGEIRVVAITREGRTFLPTDGTLFRKGDRLHIALLGASSDRLRALLGLG